MDWLSSKTFVEIVASLQQAYTATASIKRCATWPSQEVKTLRMEKIQSRTAEKREILRKTATAIIQHEPRSTLWEKPVPLQIMNK
jgi:precorrin-4 methylase